MAFTEIKPAGFRRSGRLGRGSILSRCAGLIVALLAIAIVPALAADPRTGAVAQAAPQRIVRQQPDAQTQSWRAMLLAKHSEPGCFKAHYPDADWTAVPCIQAHSANRLPPSVAMKSVTAPRPAITGNFSDYMAFSSVGTKSAAGSIIEIDNLTSESDSGLGQGTYSLQMNTNGFSPPSTVCASCTGFVQFVYDQNGGGIDVQYWMLNYIKNTVTACPAGWSQNASANCFKNGAACNDPSNTTVAPVGIVPLADLPTVTLVGEADAGGNDTVAFGSGQDMVKQSACDGILSLAGKWTATEFNMFGDSNGSVATLNPGVLMTVDISLTDASDDFPSCTTVGVSSSVSTVETTNMNLAACQPTRPGIRFVEGVPPVIGGISPSLGSQDGGTPVTISGATGAPGSGFSSPVMLASFGGSFVGATCADNQCRTNVPKGAGTVPVTVENITSVGAAGPPSTQIVRFSYAPFPFAIIDPKQGPAAGGTKLTLSGHNLGLSPGATAITFDFASGPVNVGTVTCSADPSADPEFAQKCAITTPALPDPPSSGSSIVGVSATVAGLTSPVGGFTYLGPVAPPVTCEQCEEQGEMCVIRNRKPVCVCERSSPTGECQ